MSLPLLTFQDMGSCENATLGKDIDPRCTESASTLEIISGVGSPHRTGSERPSHLGTFNPERLSDRDQRDDFGIVKVASSDAAPDRGLETPSGVSHIDVPLSYETDDPSFELLTAAKALMGQACLELKERLEAILRKPTERPLNEKTVQRIFLSTLAPQLLSILNKTMVLELNVARIQGSLRGATPQDRYRDFATQIGQPEKVSAIMREYPELASQLDIRIAQWSRCIAEFVERLCSDWAAILEKIVPATATVGHLVKLEIESDRHRGGRCVLVATFDSGFKLVYKPKSMAVDQHFQELLEWINVRSNQPPLHTLRVLNRGSYGWSEFAASASCHSIAEVRRFYERQGAYLALLYLLEATDFHNENIIAFGEHPILVDLEALFHPRISIDEELDAAALSHSVLRVSLLPWHAYSNMESVAIDLSGLGGAPGQVTPYTVPCWERVGTDEMRLVRKRLPIIATANRPSVHGKSVELSDYVQDITTGFVSMYALLMNHRDELLSAEGPLQRFAEDDVRVILRPTKTYGVLLTESFHPDVMRNRKAREVLLDRLHLAVRVCPYLARVIGAEREDLQNGDIPYFSTRPHSLHLWSGRGKCFENFFEQSALAAVDQRVKALSEHDLDLQCWLIKASLASTMTGHTQQEQCHARADKQESMAIDRRKLLKAACAVGDRLTALAIRADENASWIGLSPTNDRQWDIATSGLDLYDGLPGIALFLAYLGSVTFETRFSDLAQEACNNLLRRWERYQSIDASIGGFVGWGGVLYALSNLGSLWSEPRLWSAAEKIIHVLPELIGKDQSFDVIAGSAGCIASLIAFYRQRPSAEVLDAAKRCGEHLRSQATPTYRGVGWIIPQQTHSLAGFAHGSAGIAWSLLELSKVTGEQHFKRIAEQAISHERTLFDPAIANWRDLRSSTGKSSSSMCAWCHGAAGLGLARLTTLGELDSDELRCEIDIALATTIRVGFGGNHCLCHGDLGNIELLLQAASVLKDSRWNLKAHRIANPIVERVLSGDYRCGTPLNVESPGLMTGLAGIGYGLLRVAAPEHVPSILTLQPALGA